jgi:hypothetical protein
MPKPVPDIIDLAKRFRRDLEREEAKALQRLIDSYGLIYERVQDKVDLLISQIAEQGLSKGGVKRLERYKELQQILRRELTRYQYFVGMEMQTVSLNAVEVGINNAKYLSFTDPLVVSSGWNTIDRRVVETLTGFLDTSGPLYKRLDKLAPTVADKVSATILQGVGIGQNPKVTARQIMNSFGVGLDDSMRMMRTVQIYSYREANRASYIANEDVVRGWYWMSALDPDSCLSCINMHGSFHTNDEVLDDHHNGFCTELPATIGSGNPLGSDTAGKEWFDKLPESEQRQRMGDSKYEAFKEGKFEFSQLSFTHEDEVYGQMRAEASLKSLLGQEE